MANEINIEMLVRFKRDIGNKEDKCKEMDFLRRVATPIIMLAEPCCKFSNYVYGNYWDYHISFSTEKVDYVMNKNVFPALECCAEEAYVSDYDFDSFIDKVQGIEDNPDEVDKLRKELSRVGHMHHSDECEDPVWDVYEGKHLSEFVKDYDKA